MSSVENKFKVRRLEENQVIKIFLKIYDDVLKIENVSYSAGVAPLGKMDFDAPVPPGVIGYWVDIMGVNNEFVLYRRYIHNTLPLNIPELSRTWNKSPCKTKCFEITLPIILGAKSIKLYEQCFRSKFEKLPTRS